MMVDRSDTCADDWSRSRGVISICEMQMGSPSMTRVELNTLKRAQEEAARSLADMVRDAAPTYDGKAPQEMAVEVRDDFGPVLLVRFTFEFGRLRKQS